MCQWDWGSADQQEERPSGELTALPRELQWKQGPPQVLTQRLTMTALI